MLPLPLLLLLARLASGAASPAESGGDGDLAPNVVHFIFGLKEDFGGKPWGMVQYLAVRSASERLQPTAVFLHYVHRPSGPWFDLALPYLTLNRVEPVTEVFGIPVHHVAHRADVLRLQLLKERGGIYMDLDVISIAPFGPELRRHAFVMGMEGHPGVRDAEFRAAYSWRSEGYVLCNAVMVAKAGARFIDRWLEHYRHAEFASEGTNWASMSVVLPARLAREHPEDVHVVGPRAFFNPLWTRQGLRSLFHPSHSDPGLFTNAPGMKQRAYAVHLWDKVSYAAHTRDLTPDDVLRGPETSFNLLVRQYLHDLVVQPALGTTGNDAPATAVAADAEEAAAAAPGEL